MTEATGFEAKTIHRLLEVDPKSGGFKRGENNPLDCDLDGYKNLVGQRRF
jgi:exodeoxyribonuclease V alpha subunit